MNKHMQTMVLALGLIGAAQAQSVDELAWLAGDWGSEVAGEWVEEHWTTPRGGLMLGTNRSGKGDRASAFEFLRIQADSQGKPVYWAQPGGAPPVAFAAVKITANEAVFANPEHDYPKEVSYRRSGDVLIARIAGTKGADAMEWRWTRQPAR